MSGDSSNLPVEAHVAELSRRGRWIVLAAAFLGWMFAGLEMSIMPLVVRPVILSFHELDGSATGAAAKVSAEIAESGNDAEGLKPPVTPRDPDSVVGQWLAWYTCAFLLGAAAGGALFGALGDRFGRARAMGWAILCYSIFTGTSYLARSPEDLLVLRFLACLGVGGMWPNGVALVAEAWPDVSRPTLAGLIGTAANVGFVALGLAGLWFEITPDSWRWVFALGGAPVLLGVASLALVPESPAWLRQRALGRGAKQQAPLIEVLRPPLGKWTLLGILLGAIPVLGNWGGANWLIPWADKAAGGVDPTLKAKTQILRSTGAALGSLLGGWMASLLGRRTTYFVISLAALVTSATIYHFLTPLDSWFAPMAFALGFVGVAYFGWLPLYLPELFPTKVRATGTGVAFNAGRILTVPGVLGAGWLIQHFNGNYGKVGAVTSLIYVVGMVVICFAPDTTGRKLHDDGPPQSPLAADRPMGDANVAKEPRET